MSNIESELVLRGTISDISKLEKKPHEIINQFESHTFLKERGQITNRCRELRKEDGTTVYSAATKYRFESTGAEKTSVELEQETLTKEEFFIVAGMLEQHVLKRRWKIQKDGFLLDIDNMWDFSTGKWSMGFKIDIEGSARPTTEELTAIIAEEGLVVAEWLEVQVWGEKYNKTTREYFELK